MILTRSAGVFSPTRYHFDKLLALNPLIDHAVVIVPEQYTLQAERDIMEGLSLKGLFHIEVTSFKRIWARMAQSYGLGHRNHEPLTDLGKKMVIRQILKSQNEQLNLYRGTYKNKGFLSDLVATIESFRQNAITPQFLSQLSKQVPEATLFGNKLREISSIYATYVAYFQGSSNLYDEHFLVENLIDKMKSSQPSNVNDVIYIVEGFSSMTQLEVNFLSALSLHSKEMYIRIIDEQDEAVCLRYPKTLYRQLIHTFTSDHIGVSVQMDDTGRTQAASHFMEIFSDAPTLVKDPVLQGKSAKDRSSELSAIMLDMVTAHKEEGIAWEHMALLTEDLRGYATLAHRLFNDFNIPHFIDAKRPATAHMAIDFTLTSLKAVMTFYSTQDVLKVLKTGFSHIMPYYDLCRFENYALSKGLKGKLWFLPWNDESVIDLEPHRGHVMSQLEALRFGLNKDEQGVGAIQAYLQEVGLLKQLAEGTEEAKLKKDFQLAEERAQIHNIIDHVLYQIQALSQEMSLEIIDFYDLLKLGFEGYEIGIIPPARHFVTMGNISRTRLSAVERLYIAGVNEGIMPSRAEGSGLFLDDEAQWLVDQGFDRMKSTHAQYDEEVYKTYEHILRCKGPVWLSYAKFNTEGQGLKPSLWMNLLSSTQTEGSKIQDLQVNYGQYRTQGLWQPFLKGILNDWSQDPGLAWTRETLEAMKGICSQGQEILDHFKKGMAYKNHVQNLEPQLIKQIYGDLLRTSVTRLEAFSQCPYQHFVQYALKPATLETPKLTGIDMGNLFHGVFESFMDQIMSMPRPISKEAWEPIFESVYQEKHSQVLRFEYSAQNQYFGQKLKGVLKEALDHAIKHINESQFSILKNELAFGMGLDKDAPPKVLTTSQGTLYLEGKIDRLDLYMGKASKEGGDFEQAYMSIIDYKSSNQNLTLSDVYHGLKLQLMVYLDVAITHAKHLVDQQSQPFGAFYYKIDDPIIDTDGSLGQEEIEQNRHSAFQLEGLCLNDPDLLAKADAQFAELGQGGTIKAKLNKNGEVSKAQHLLQAENFTTLMTYAIAKSQEVAEAIYEGEIAITPVKQGQKQACTYCEFKAICQFDPKKQGQNYAYPATYTAEEALNRMEEDLKCRGLKNKQKQ